MWCGLESLLFHFVGVLFVLAFTVSSLTFVFEEVMHIM